MFSLVHRQPLFTSNGRQFSNPPSTQKDLDAMIADAVKFTLDIGANLDYSAARLAMMRQFNI